MDTPNEPGIRHIAIEEEMSSSYIDYSMSVIVQRALPRGEMNMAQGFQPAG